MNNMTMEMNMQKSRKLIFQLAGGGLMGGLAGYFGASFMDMQAMAADQVIVSAIGLVYLLIGLIVGFGLIAPKLGSHVLNVEDAEEIREQSRILTGSVICMVGLGAALVALSASGPNGSVPPLIGFGGLLASLLLLIVITIRDWKYYDEMMRELSRDAGNLAFGGIGGAILIWSSAASLNLVNTPSPLSLVAIISGGFLLSVFVASARKGMLQPR
jgi:hypothetical protein